MNIGILTLPFNNNYGGYLQSYALSQVLKSLGHQVTLINRRPAHVRRYSIKYSIKQVLKSIIYRERFDLVYDSEKLFLHKGKNILPFMKEAYHEISEPLYDSVSLASYCGNRFDAIIVGSDQIWRPDYVDNVYDFFLDFINNTHTLKIAYAASFGSDEPIFTENQFEHCGKSLATFKGVSLREQSGLSVMRSMGWKTEGVQIVLDPTMLLSKEHYISIFSKQGFPECSNFLFQYILDVDEKKNKVIENLAIHSKLDIFNCFNTKSRRSLYSLKEWLSFFFHASLIVTDSFHGTVFAILFNKPFIVMQNENRGNSRLTSLLENFELKDRMIRSTDDYIRILNQTINWYKVNEILNKRKKESMDFLETALNEDKIIINPSER